MHIQVEKSVVVRNELSANKEAEISNLSGHTKYWHYIYLVYPSLIVLALIISFIAWQSANTYLIYGTTAVSILMIGVALNSCFSLIHEATHGHLSANGFRNRWLAVLLSGLGFFSYSAYKVLHIRHHQYLGDKRDPDEYSNYVKQRWLIWVLHYVRLLCACLLYLVLIPWFAIKHASRQERLKIFIEYLILIVAYGFIIYFIPLKLLVLFWLCPWILTNFMVNIRGLVQHGLTDHQDPMIASRTLVVHPIVEFFMIYENYHLEHHLFPEIPAYNLRKLRSIIEPRLSKQVTCYSYLGFLFKFFKASLTLNEKPIGFITKENRDSS